MPTGDCKRKFGVNSKSYFGNGALLEIRVHPLPCLHLKCPPGHLGPRRAGSCCPPLLSSNADPLSPPALQNRAARGFCQDANPTVSSDARIKAQSSELCAAQLPDGCSPSPAAPSAQPSAGKGARPLPARGRGGSKTQLCYEAVRASEVLRPSGERRGFAATVWKSQRLSLKGLKTALQNGASPTPPRGR